MLNRNINDETIEQVDDNEPVYGSIDDDDSEYGTPFAPAEDETVVFKRKVRSDIYTVVSNIGINAFPILVDAFKHRHDETPYKIPTSDIIRVGVGAIVPTIQLADTLWNKSRIQNTIEDKTPFKLSDIRNLVNIIQAYPAAHRALSNFMENVSRSTESKQQIDLNSRVKRDTYVGIATVISPFISDKFSDERMSITQKISSIIPIKMFGGFVRRIADTNPTLRRGYDAMTAIVKVADFGNQTIGSAVKTNNGVARNVQNQLGSALELIQDVTGMSRNRLSRYGSYDDYGSSRWNTL